MIATQRLHARAASFVPSTPKVVGIVLNWNGWLDTIECLESLMRSSVPLDQIVVCDNGSSDRSIDRIVEWAEGSLIVESGPSGSKWRYKPVDKPISYEIVDAFSAMQSAQCIDAQLVIVRIPRNEGYAGGNNVGMRYALARTEAEYVWILNNDVVVERDALRQLLQTAQLNPQSGITGPSLLQYHQPDVIQALGGGGFVPALGLDTQLGNGKRYDLLSAKPASIEVDHLIGASLLVRTEAIRAVGLLDESYFLYREETDWCLRMRKLNWQLICSPNACVWHKQGQSIGVRTNMHDYYSVRNMLHLIRTYHPAALPSAMLTICARAIIPKIARLQFQRLWFVMRALWDFARGVRGRAHSDTELIRARSYRRAADQT